MQSYAWRPEVARPGNFVRNFCACFGKTTPYGNILKILFRKFTWRQRSTLLCSNVVQFVRREIGEIVRYLPDQNKFRSAPVGSRDKAQLVKLGDKVSQKLMIFCKLYYSE